MLLFLACTLVGLAVPASGLAVPASGLAVPFSGHRRLRTADSDFQCPSRCTCDASQLFVNCSRLDSGAIPDNIPVQTVQLVLELDALTSLPAGAFSSLTQLQLLDVSSNKLSGSSGVGNESFEGLNNLTDFDISFNDLIIVPFGLPTTLRSLRLIQCKLDSISQEYFASMTNLTYLDVSYNFIVFLDADLFTGNPNLETLEIEFNQLNDDAFAYAPLKNLTKLSILAARFNKLENIPIHLPAQMEHLDFVGNPIKTIKSSDLPYPKIQTFSLWQSPLTVIENNAFKAFKELQILDLNSASIAYLTNETLSNLPMLKQAYLYSNKIKRIQEGAFHGLPSLQLMWLGGNQLTELTPGVLLENQKPLFSQVDLTFNPWNCDCKLRWLRELMDSHPDFLADPHLMTCASPPGLAKKAWDVLKPSDFKC